MNRIEKRYGKQEYPTNLLDVINEAVNVSQLNKLRMAVTSGKEATSEILGVWQKKYSMFTKTYSYKEAKALFN